MIPLALASKLGNYKVKLGRVEVTVKLIKHPSLVAEKLSELKTLLVNQSRVVATTAESLTDDDGLRWLVLCVGNRCLMVDLWEVNPIPESLKAFMEDQSICFVGVKMGNQISRMRHRGIECKTGVELSDLAALVKKNPDLEGISLSDLAYRLFGKDTNFGLAQQSRLPSTATTTVDWSANVFSDDQMPRVIHDVFYSYVVGNSLLHDLR